MIDTKKRELTDFLEIGAAVLYFRDGAASGTAAVHGLTLVDEVYRLRKLIKEERRAGAEMVCEDLSRILQKWARNQ